MPFQEIRLDQQNSQRAKIEVISYNYLICKTSGFDTNGDLAQVDIIVSRPLGLRTWDKTHPGEVYGTIGDDGAWLTGTSPQHITGADEYFFGSTDTSGKSLSITPPYRSGEAIYFTKKISDPLRTSQAIDYYTSATDITDYDSDFKFGDLTGTGVLKMADHFVDENREGRSWLPPEGGNGVPSGFVEKCVAFCEDGQTVSGQILFKTGCDEATGPTGPTSSSGPSGPTSSSGPSGPTS
jgi:hypothetical protein